VNRRSNRNNKEFDPARQFRHGSIAGVWLRRDQAVEGRNTPDVDGALTPSAKARQFSAVDLTGWRWKAEDGCLPLEADAA
jgi:hypothetical protein